MITTERTLEERYESVHRGDPGRPQRRGAEVGRQRPGWRLEGHVGRIAMAALQDGAVVLPPHRVKDFYGVTVPSYRDVEDEVGSPGSVANAEALTPEGECLLCSSP